MRIASRALDPQQIMDPHTHLNSVPVHLATVAELAAITRLVGFEQAAVPVAFRLDIVPLVNQAICATVGGGVEALII